MMKNIDYRKIKLEDTGVYEPDKNAFSYLFPKYKITTVGQVLDDDLMKRLFYGFKLTFNAERELDGFRKLLKYKYLCRTMNNDSFLERSILNSNEFFYPYEDMYYSELGISYDKIKKLKSVFEVLSQKKKKLTVLDILNEIANSENWKNTDPILYNVAKLNVHSYNKSKNLLEDEYDTLLQLRVKLFSLIDERNNLDAQIEHLQQKLDKLVKNNTESGVSK